MKKNVVAKRIKVKAELNKPINVAKESPNGKENKEETNDIASFNDENIYRCPKCFNIPLINVKDNENKVVIDCLKGHRIDMLFSEYMSPEFQKNINRYQCGKCGANPNSQKFMNICYECQQILCEECLSSHNQNNANHHLITFDKLDSTCPIHKLKFTSYCLDCKTNICDDCVKDKCENHEKKLLDNKSSKINKLSELKNNLEKENQTLFNIKTIFNDTLNQLSNNFNDIISYKFLCLKYKTNIINTYETKDINYQIINNLDNLKFITKKLKIEPEMNELDIIYELFNFLDSIEYNDEYNSNEENGHSNNNRLPNDKNKMMFDSNNKIEESDNEDDGDGDEDEKGKNENKNNKIKIEDNNIKEEEKDYEDENEEEEKGEEFELKHGKDKDKENEDFIITKNKNNLNVDDENENERSNNNEEINNEKENNKHMKKNSDDNIIDEQLSPILLSNEKKEENGDVPKEKEEIKDINVEEDNIQNKNEEKEKDYYDDEDNDDDISNDNEDNIFIYKTTRHIPVNTDYNKTNKQENLAKTENNEETETKEKETKKKKKKIKKKKKTKIPVKLSSSQPELEGKTLNKPKKNIKKAKSKDVLIPKKEEYKEDEETKEKVNNNNMRIEVNESYSQDISINKDEIENETNKNPYKKKLVNNKNEELKDVTPNKEIKSKTDESENVSMDNISNDYKLEEVPNTNHEEFSENKVIFKKMKAVKKKKKKKINLPKFEQNKQIDVIKIDPINGFKIEDNNDTIKSSDVNKEENLESDIIKTIEAVKNDILNDEYNKSKRSTVTKKLNFGSSEKDVNEESVEDKKDTKEKNSEENNNIKIEEVKTDDNNNDSNRIVNMVIDDQNITGKKSPVIKKRKKIKKKKYLITTDNNEKPEIEERQIKITKTTTLIRSRSKDRKKERSTSDDNLDSNLPNNNNKNNKQTTKAKAVNYKILKNDITDTSDDNETENNNGQTTKSKGINVKVIKNDIKQSPNYNKGKNDKKIEEKEIKFTKFNNTINSPNYNDENITNIKIISNGKTNNKKSHKMRMAHGNNKVALIFENKEDIYLEKRDIKYAKKSGINKFEEELDQDRNRSMDRVQNRNKNRKLNNEYNIDEIRFMMDRSNSYKKINKYKKFSEREKINCIKFENGISCFVEINPQIFALGNLIGDIVIINYHTYREVQVIKEHDGTIISLYLLHDNSILSCSADRKMLKIRVNEDGTQYKIEFIFTGYENYILKGIELMNSFKIITCSWDDKLFLWEKLQGKGYKNTSRFNLGERVVDLLEINATFFVSISENSEFKIWNSETCENLYNIKNIKCIGAPNALCKINDFIVSVLDYHAIHLIDIMEHRVINKIIIDDGNLSCIIKLNDNSILLAEDFNNDKYCVFYIKQFYFDDKDLKPISHKKDKFYKTNKNNDKEIRALAQFSNEVIVQGITGEYNGTDSGDLFFYY